MQKADGGQWVERIIPAEPATGEGGPSALADGDRSRELAPAWRIVSSCGVIALLGLVTATSRPATAWSAPTADAATPLVVVDNPAAGSSVSGRGVLQGWAADPGSG